MSNPFDLLGNDVEDANVVVPVPRELVKKNTSSKKADVPPPSANPARANPNRPRPSGNEGAIRDKTAGRDKNRHKDVPVSAAEKKTNTRKATDRHSRTGKVDTKKRVNQGWGSNKDEGNVEQAAEVDAAEQLEADNEESEDSGVPAVPLMSLQDYLNQVAKPESSDASDIAAVEQLKLAENFVKKEEEVVAPSKVKNLKSKQLKAKEYLNFDATFSDALPQRQGNNNRRGGSSRGGARGGSPRGGARGGNRGGARGGNRGNAQSNKGGNPVQVHREIDTSNLPSLA